MMRQRLQCSLAPPTLTYLTFTPTSRSLLESFTYGAQNKKSNEYYELFFHEKTFSHEIKNQREQAMTTQRQRTPAPTGSFTDEQIAKEDISHIQIRTGKLEKNPKLTVVGQITAW